jgi:hypothetical protein
MLAILDGAASVRWTDIVADVGAGSLVLSTADPKVGYCSEGNLIKIALGGTAVFSYFIEAPVLTSGEAAESTRTLAGRSALSYLDQAIVYPLGWPSPMGDTRYWVGGSFGGILSTLLSEAQARGTLPALTWDFTLTHDSKGNAWPADLVLMIDVSASYLDVAKKFVALGMGLAMSPGLVLHCYIPGSYGSDLTSSVVWRQGYHIAAPVTNVGSRSGIKTVSLVKGAGGIFTERTDPTYTGDPTVGRRETGLDYSTTSGNLAQMMNAGDQQIALTEAAANALTVSLTHGTGGLYEPYSDYNLGDTIALDIPGSYSLAPYQIVGLTVAQTVGANYTVEANLGAIALPIELQLRQWFASVAGASAVVGLAGNLSLTAPRTYPFGSVFPGNPTSGMVFYYLGQWYYWSGTAWVLIPSPNPRLFFMGESPYYYNGNSWSPAVDPDPRVFFFHHVFGG